MTWSKPACLDPFVDAVVLSRWLFVSAGFQTRHLRRLATHTTILRLHAPVTGSSCHRLGAMTHDRALVVIKNASEHIHSLFLHFTDACSRLTGHEFGMERSLLLRRTQVQPCSGESPRVSLCKQTGRSRLVLLQESIKDRWMPPELFQNGGSRRRAAATTLTEVMVVYTVDRAQAPVLKQVACCVQTQTKRYSRRFLSVVHLLRQ